MAADKCKKRVEKNWRGTALLFMSFEHRILRLLMLEMDFFMGGWDGRYEIGGHSPGKNRSLQVTKMIWDKEVCIVPPEAVD
jgi:hypothetical protein